MKIKPTTVLVKDLCKNYEDKRDLGVYAYNGKLKSWVNGKRTIEDNCQMLCVKDHKLMKNK